MRLSGRYFLSSILVVCVSCLVAHAQTQHKSEQVLADLTANPLPVADVPAMADPDYAKDFDATLAAAKAKRAGLILELYRLDPRGPKTAELLPERWKTLAQTGNVDKALAEMSAYLGTGID